MDSQFIVFVIIYQGKQTIFLRVVNDMGYAGSCAGGLQSAAFVLVLYILLVIILRAI